MNEEQNQTKEVREELIKIIKELDSKHTASVPLYNAYWHARTLLRNIALTRYSEVFEEYDNCNMEPAFPMEGYEEIFKDSHEMIDIMLRYAK